MDGQGRRMNRKDEINVSYTSQDPYGSDFPEISRALSYWDKIRRDRSFPAWREFDWFQLPVTANPYCGVVDVKTSPVNFYYRFWGTAHATATKQELTGRPVYDMHPRSEARSVFAQYAETLHARAPRLFVNTIVSYTLLSEMTEISLRLPFSDDGERIQQILAFSDMRPNADIIGRVFDTAAEQ